MKYLVLLCIAFYAFDLNAQCEIDTTNTEIISVIPCPSLMNADTCGFDTFAIVGQPFSFTVDLYGPEEVDLPPVLDFDQLVVDDVLNLPAGLQYACNPPDCVFESLEHGCVEIFGVPTLPVEPDTCGVYYSVRVLFTATLGIIEISDTFPGTLFPGYFPLFLDCPLGYEMKHITPFSVDVVPNPANEVIQVSIDAEQSNDLNIEILDFTGKVVKSRAVEVSSGNNFFDIAVNDLQPGIYLYSVGNQEGVITSRLLIARE